MSAALSQARTAVTTALASLNSLTKYPSILTLHALGERGRLTADLTTPAISGAPLLATEKIDGTSARLLVFADGSWVVGSREHLLTVSGDLLFDPAVGIVEGLRRLVMSARLDSAGHVPSLAYAPSPTTRAALTVLYGEFYGGKVTAQSKQYALPDQVGFRVFDVAVFADPDSVAQQLRTEGRDLATWRETETPWGLRYGQPFLPADQLATYLAQVGLAGVPTLPTLTLTSVEATHEYLLAWLRQHLPHTQAQLPGLGVGQAGPRAPFCAQRTGQLLSKFGLRITNAPCRDVPKANVRQDKSYSDFTVVEGSFNDCEKVPLTTTPRVRS